MAQGKIDAVCPKCGAVLDGYSTPEKGDIKPDKGDITVCLYCGAVCTFLSAEGGLRVTLEKEIAALNKQQRHFIRVAAYYFSHHQRPPFKRAH